MFKKLKDFLFKKEQKVEISLKTLSELDYLDYVWIKDRAGDILRGWVFDVNKKHIIVTVPIGDKQFLDYRFNITRPLSQTELTQNNTTLYLNKPCE